MFVFLVMNSVAVYMCSVTQSCPTLSNTMDCSLRGCSVRGVFHARILEWVAISLSRDLPHPRLNPRLLNYRWILYHCATWEAMVYTRIQILILFSLLPKIRVTVFPTHKLQGDRYILVLVPHLLGRSYQLCFSKPWAERGEEAR